MVLDYGRGRGRGREGEEHGKRAIGVNDSREIVEVGFLVCRQA